MEKVFVLNKQTGKLEYLGQRDAEPGDCILETRPSKLSELVRKDPVNLELPYDAFRKQRNPFEN
jgi:hypothetical protein